MSSLAIDTNLIYLQRRLGFSADKLLIYQGMSTEEVIQAETAAGNPIAIKFAEELMTNPELLIELFQLADPQNKFIILMQLSEDELIKILPMLEEEDLVQGLMFFTEDKLMKMLEEVPPEQLVKTVLELFSKEDIIELIPEKQLDKLLQNKDIDKYKVLDHLKSIPPEFLKQMIESVTGEPCDENDPVQLVKQISQFNPLEYKNALENLEVAQKRKLVLRLIKDEEKYMQFFDPEAYTKIISQQKEKPEMVKAMNVLEQEELVKMIQELPKELMSMVLTQIDTQSFAEDFMMKRPELIAKLIAG